MNFLDSGLYRALGVVANLILLNALWLIACVPVITAFPATAAMFGVVREWERDREPGILRGFFAFFRENFKQSLWVGVLWMFLGAALAADFLLLGQISSAALRIPMLVLLAFGGFLFAATSIYLFPVMVNYEVGWRTLVKNSLFFAVGLPVNTLACLLIVGAAVAITIFVPITVLATGGVTSYAVYKLCDRSFRKVGALKGAEEVRYPADET